MAEMARALGNPHRLELLNLLSQGERNVDRLAELTGMSVANTSQHLQALRRNGLVDVRRAGKHAFYGLSNDQTLAALQALTALTEANSAAMQQILSDYFWNLDALEPVTRDELEARLGEGVVVLDARPEDEYALGHLPGAICVPDGTVETLLKTLPRDRTIVAYCRGSYCISSFRLVARLRALGYDVRRLEEGFPEWRANGRPVEEGRPDLRRA
ncbi:metalloregulator ArsR/SmtB family transcription factor [Pseudooceanicola sp. CBS1P-1]|nr:metalloregulator ArsR/SmtB family transcription factor [Pseudooceanicola albus]MBT9386459.1 metalloregulator ArsR/SmtB family transcription factor [Pseudooceanicola endophyticus]